MLVFMNFSFRSFSLFLVDKSNVLKLGKKRKKKREEEMNYQEKGEKLKKTKDFEFLFFTKQLMSITSVNKEGLIFLEE